MRKLNKPLDSPEDIFKICISHVRDINLKNRLDLCVATIVAASEEFETKASNATLHTIATSNTVAGIVTASEMEKVYTNRMVDKKSPGRPFYDKLISMPSHGICPLCGQRVVSTLDHHLPKAYYPALAVSPLNLVPSCKDCNTTKLNALPLTSDEETLHPYFDDVENDYWLYSKVVEKSPAALIFDVNPPNSWSNVLRNRIKHHFKVLRLADLYSSHAAVELINIRFSLEKAFEADGAIGVRSSLQDAASSRAMAFKNSWQTAMYRGLVTNNWFCNGGFKNV